ncbi:methyltransferase domain-containing protein [Kitasatospora sp. MAP5-34]|uniref:methyltransferase domain-containing protein n=1 Tax=Kitasatospora sp. MAP5-34 TaxID=3035102 RepID=UPI00247592B4|nr:methyltransferase domain-containing protein [Kitasatospora sp. MAP5-34]MDH6577646.1 protein-L-isoaspartate(D-aspartate) O-methyltransferase [Kitasatospora sp. MAP5-34]
MIEILDDEQLLMRARIELVTEIERGSIVLSSRVAEAFLNVPRHPFVPVFYRRVGSAYVPWRVTDGTDAEWLRQVYTDQALITEVDGMLAEDAAPNGRTGAATSSSTMPSLMADMLDALDVHHGARVLEIGTGTGYNAALLSYLAGAENVTTIDYTAPLVLTARTRLREAGLEPKVLRGDGAAGQPDGGPFDRIIATCSVRRIPQSWLDQCAPGGVIVAPIKGTLDGGAVACLTKLPDGGAAGRFLHTPAAFMPLLSGPEPLFAMPDQIDGAQRTTETSGRVLDDYGFSFWAHLHMNPTTVRRGRLVDGQHVTTLYDHADSSAAFIRDRADGPPAVTTTGPRDLWKSIEAAHEHWRRQNRPRREWLTIDATTAGQSISYAAPDGSVSRWPL